VSWVYEHDGYHLLCNRDEKKSRASGLGPRVQARHGVQFIAPIDPESGGTWIAVNEFGLSTCLLNGANVTRRLLRNTRKTVAASSAPPEGLASSFTVWRRASAPFALPRNLRGGERSRGLLLRELISAQSTASAASRLKQLDLAPFAPFTIVFLRTQEQAIVAEWNGECLRTVPSGDSLMPLTSSSYDGEGVHRARRNEFARKASTLGQIDKALLHAFHRSHGESPDAYSTCMHRADAETVSFSWVAVSKGEIRFLYLAGPPCAANNSEEQVLRRAA
jgi:hypothetical protein